MIGLLGSRRHSRLRGLLSDYIDGQISDSDASRVEDHLATCKECGQELATLRATVGLLKRLPQLEVPRSFTLAEAPAEGDITRPIAWAVRIAAPVAVLLLVALILGDALGIVSQGSEPMEETTSPSAATGASPEPPVVIPAPATEGRPIEAAAEVQGAVAPPVTSREEVVAVAEVAVPETERGPAEATPESMISRTGQPTTQASAPIAAPAPAIAKAARQPTEETMAAASVPTDDQLAVPKVSEQTSEPSAGLALPLWQLEVGVGIALGATLLVALWTSRRERRPSQ